jgi:hypothetical protein
VAYFPGKRHEKWKNEVLLKKGKEWKRELFLSCWFWRLVHKWHLPLPPSGESLILQRLRPDWISCWDTFVFVYLPTHNKPTHIKVGVRMIQKSPSTPL